MERKEKKEIWSRLPFRRMLYCICFCMFCVIDQRIRTAYGQGGWLETFRDLTGVVMAVIILSHYRPGDFRKWKIPYIIWSVVGGGAGIAAFCWGIGQQICLMDWFVILLDVFLFGYILIHTFIAVVLEKKRARLNKKFAVIWFLMMILMVVSRSEQIWPLCYLVMFGCFYLTDYSGRELDDLFQGMLDGVILSFFLLQGLAFVFRPYDEIRYKGIYFNTNMNALYYLEVLAAVLSKLLLAARRNVSKWLKLYYWLGLGAVLAFLFMTVGRTAWITAFVLVSIFLWAGKKGMGKSILKRGMLVIICACLMFPVCFGAARYLPPVFHHPIWYGNEWNEERVHSWDPWDSNKYVSLEEFWDFAVGRLIGSFGAVFDHSPFLINADAAEAEPVGKEPEIELKDDAAASMEERMEIYQYYFSHLNLWGNAKKEEGWGWHGHNILLQFGTDFGVVVLALFIVLYGWNVSSLLVRFGKSRDERYVGMLFFSLITLLYGMLELSSGPGGIGTIMMFFAWGSTIRLDTDTETG